MKNKKRNRIFLLLILLLGVTVGFAALATTLKINGISKVKKATWSIHWDNVANEKGITATTPAYIKDTKKTTVEYEVFFTEPGQYYEFTVDAVNEGTLDGEITQIVSTVNGNNISTLPAYVKYSVKYADGTDVALNDVLESGDTRTYKVHIEYDSEAVTNEIVNGMTTDQSYVFTYEVKYSQKSSTPESFAADSWKTIAKEGNNAAKQTTVTDGKCGAYNVGDTKTIDMGDLGTHTVRIANCSTPSVCSTEGFSETSCGFVIEFADAIGTRRMNPSAYTQYSSQPGHFNTGGWESSEIRAYINGSSYLEGTEEENSFAGSGIYDKLPTKLKDAIKKTKVVSGYGSVDAAHGNFETEDKLFLLAIHEIYLDSGSGSMKNNAKDWDYTRQLDYYTGSDSGNYGNVNNSGIYLTAKKNGTSDVAWWTRTANSNYYWYFYVVASGGGWRNTENYETANGVSPAFKLK